MDTLTCLTCGFYVLSSLSGDSHENKAENYFTKYAVNTELDVASKAGKRILERGGNAVDAAIASNLVIGVVNSFSSGIGGGGFMLIRKKEKDAELYDFIDFREVAPSKISIDHFKDNPEASKTTGLSIAVPGEVLGMVEAHKRYGKLPWKDLFFDSIQLAYSFKPTAKLIEKLEKNQQFILDDPGLRSTFTRNGLLVRETDTIERTNLAKTLETISKDPDSFYKGDIADKIVNFIKDNQGILEKEDLENYKVEFRKVLESKFYEYKVITTNLPTSGLIVIEALKILEKINIRDLKHFITKDNSYKMYHIIIEILKFASAERGRLGDPAFLKDWENIANQIISEENINEIFKKFNLEKSLKADEYGSNILFKEDNGTTHLNVIDDDDLLVLMTSTINLEFGSKLLDPETGIIFNNQIDDFYIPGVDSSYDLSKMQANIIKANKRPFSSAAPTILIKDDEILAIGASGGTRIPSSLISTISYLMAGNSLETSISLCRMHNQLSPFVTYIEPTLPNNVIDKLKEMGHVLEVSELNTSFSAVQAIQVFMNGKQKKIIAVSDKRKGGVSHGL